jgi:hypothetical protein
MRTFTILLLLAGLVACDDATTIPTAPSTTIPPFESQLVPGGTAARSLTMNNPGTIRATLTSTTPAAVVGLGVGMPSGMGQGCALTRSITTGPGSSPQLTLPADAGVYCVLIYDTGTLQGPISFSISLSYP